MKDLYKILNLTASASDEAIKRSYRTLAKLYHPDLNPDNAAAAKRFEEINEAYDVLSDAQKRAEYDAKVRAEKAQARARAEAQNYARQTPVSNNAKTQSASEQTYEAQLQADANAVLTAVHDSAYKEGYTAGHNSASAEVAKLNNTVAKLSQENAALKKSASGFKSDRSELETELFDRDREIARGLDRIKELEAQLEWMRRASVTDSPNSVVTKQVTTSKQRIQNLRKALAEGGDGTAKIKDTTVLAQHERRKEINEQLLKLDKAVAMISDELKDMDEQIARRHNMAETDRMISSMEANAEAWAKKTLEDQKKAAGTLYGTLGVLIWATDEQIEEAFDKLIALKTDADEKQKIKHAYAVLSDRKSRAEYDESIGYSEDVIIHEQVLIKENEAAQEQYRSKLAAKEFWTHFDELSSLALAGDAEAQNALGELYYKGDTIERDFTHAVYWFREAFENRLPAAMYNLGVCYRNGEGVHKNATIASALFRQAALRGYNG